MNCQDFLNEFEERRGLTETAMLHLKNCTGCKKISDAQTRVWQMIETLEKVDVPKDFNFRLKARIAAATPSNFEPRFLPALRYVLPLSLAVLIFAFVVFNGVNFVGNNTSPEVAENNLQPVIEKENAPVNPVITQFDSPNTSESSTNEKLIAGISNPVEQPKGAKLSGDDIKFVAGKSHKRFPIVPRKDNVKNDFKGSRDFGLSSSNINILPKGFGSNKTIETSTATDSTNSFKVEQVLSELGLEIVSENGNRKVKSITQDGLAKRSGIMVGDVIESIDGKKLSNELVRGKTIGVKKINVMRDGAKIEISLRY